jgi:hypothetical protein
MRRQPFFGGAVAALTTDAVRNLEMWATPPGLWVQGMTAEAQRILVRGRRILASQILDDPPRPFFVQDRKSPRVRVIGCPGAIFGTYAAFAT